MATDPWAEAVEEVHRLRREAEEALGHPSPDVSLEIPLPEYGDLALPTHAYAKLLRKSPPAVAQELAEAMPSSELVQDVEAQGGYVNFRLALPRFGGRTLEAVLDEGAEYGRGPRRDARVLVEHTSVNPTGPIHVGRARNAIIGDTLARLLEWAGADVTREYLVNDAGRQVLTLVWGVENVPEDDLDPPERAKEDYRLVRYYRRASELAEADPGVATAIDDLIRRFEGGDEAVRERVRRVCRGMMDGILETLARLHITYDKEFWEDETVVDGSAQQVVARLQEAGYTEEEDGALFVDMAPYGTTGRDARLFLTRKDGTTLYTTRDLAYHLDKFRRSDEAVNVLGEDHRMEFRQLRALLDLLDADGNVEAVFLAFVALPEGKLSTRRGRVVYLDDLLDEAFERALREVDARREDLSAEARAHIARAVGVGAVRYNIIRVQPEKRILFRWEEALSLEGQTAPFLQYAYARAWGILRKAEEEGSEGWNADALTHPRERALLKLLARFPGTIREAAEGRRPHHTANFAHELALTFNQFYRDCPVLAAAPEVRAVRLGLVRAFQTVLGNALTILGVEPLEAM